MVTTFAGELFPSSVVATSIGRKVLLGLRAAGGETATIVLLAAVSQDNFVAVDQRLSGKCTSSVRANDH